MQKKLKAAFKAAKTPEQVIDFSSYYPDQNTALAIGNLRTLSQFV